MSTISSKMPLLCTCTCIYMCMCVHTCVFYAHQPVHIMANFQTANQLIMCAQGGSRAMIHCKPLLILWGTF